jgi:hypothetical protein
MSKPLVSGELWAIVAPLLPPERVKPQGGRPRRDGVARARLVRAGTWARWVRLAGNTRSGHPGQREGKTRLRPWWPSVRLEVGGSAAGSTPKTHGLRKISSGTRLQAEGRLSEARGLPYELEQTTSPSDLQAPCLGLRSPTQRSDFTFAKHSVTYLAYMLGAYSSQSRCPARSYRT